MMDDDDDGDGWCGPYVRDPFLLTDCCRGNITGQHFAILKKVKS
jgi:hypothetical protein